MTAPAGSMNLAVKYCRDMLSACSEFQTWTDSVDATAALERIYYEGLPMPANLRRHTKAELEHLRPFAIVYTADEDGFTRELLATDAFSEHGTIILHLEQNAPSDLGDDPSSDANIQWSNTIGNVVDDLCDLRVTAAAGHVLLLRIRLVERYWANANEIHDLGLFQRATLAIDY